jgi:two-component system NarL family sensor kinase
MQRAGMIQGLEFQYQTIQKDMELTRKELIISQQQQAIHTRTTLTGIATSATIIITLLSFIFYKNTKNRQQMQAEKLRAARHEQDILKKQEAINVMQALMEGEEKERRRIAQELHDGIGGRLAALQMYCSSEEIAARLGSAHFAEITHMLESTAEEIRDTAHNLMPDALSRYSFSDALEMYCRQISANNTLEIHLQIHAAPDVLPPSTQLSLYRAIQEVLQNIIKHAHATQATLQFNREGEAFIIIIEDNGDGFHPGTEGEYQGLGLVNIRNRIKALNGHLLIESSPGRGTIIQMEIPIAEGKQNI